MTSERVAATSRLPDKGSLIAISMAVMNVATYLFTYFAARRMGTEVYGAFAALMNVLIVVSVLSLALQATAARRISADPEHVAQIEREILRVTWRAAVVLGLVLLALSPLLKVALRLDSLATAALVSLVVVPLTLMGGQAGILQGERRWAPLGLMYVAAGVPRLVLGTALILWRPTELWAMVGVLLGALVPVAVGWWSLRGHRDQSGHSDLHGGGPVLRESLVNSQALLAFFALSNVDIVIARNVLDGHDAGLYAGGLILTKAVIFLPQFVVVVAFPSMSTSHERRRALNLSLVLVAALGAAVTLGAWVLSSLALVFAGGAKYGDIEGRLWLFAILGTVIALLQLVVYSVIARQGQRSILLVWAGLAALVVGALFMHTITSLLLWVAAVDAVLLLALLTTSYRHVGQDEPLPATAP
ncbi:lipopolysaccharide biosynthesis protein [uncultured Nocardioides sp.]|uniref:lipopolysaccharide biosynthesis protein n=1 Tax=uncultured Nocardioides sp. TaxID=198441 RepID=UPI0025E29466|nr:polysaccharide biosynthesis protein [uncultured Nocardioides sp.]